MLTPANGNSHKPHQQSQATSMSVPATTHDREQVRTLAVQVETHCSTPRFRAAHASLQNEKRSKINHAGFTQERVLQLVSRHFHQIVFEN